MYTYDRTAEVQPKIFTDPGGEPTGPNTPWGKADSIREIARGVRWVGTPGHGGLGVSRGVADKVLSSAARRLGNYQGGVFWYEEDVQCNIPFFEHPEWASEAGISSSKEKFEEAVKRHYPKYFEMLSDGAKDQPKLRPGMQLKCLRDIRFGSGRSFREGDLVEVVSTTPSALVFVSSAHPGATFKAPMGYYYGHGYDADRYFEAA